MFTDAFYMCETEDTSKNTKENKIRKIFVKMLHICIMGSIEL